MRRARPTVRFCFDHRRAHNDIANPERVLLVDLSERERHELRRGCERRASSHDRAK